MSRRPYEARQQPGRGGDGWRRRWSESPIPKVAPRRVRMVGAPVNPPLAYYDWNETLLVEGDETVALDFTGYDADGMLCLAVAAGVGVTWTAPAGWTQVAAGAVGDLGYWVGSRILTGTDDLTWTVSGVAGAWTYPAAPTPTGMAVVDGWIFEAAAGGAVPSGSTFLTNGATETASATVVDVPAVGATWTEPIQIVIGTPVTATAPAHLRDPLQGWHAAPWMTERYYPSTSYSPLCLYVRLSDIRSGYEVGMWSDTSPTMTTPLAAEWVTIALGGGPA